MSELEIILIAFGLSMDAFAVSITLGLSTKNLKTKEVKLPQNLANNRLVVFWINNFEKVIITGLFFGFFQAFMPIIGYFTGIYFSNKIQEIDHWIAFVLLVIIGGKMIIESLSKGKKTNVYSFQLLKMLGLAVATSIDAFVIGITFAFFHINIIKAAIIIGLITLFISMIGIKIGNLFGAKFSSKAEFIGGIVLVLLGIKILIEHLFF